MVNVKKKRGEGGGMIVIIFDTKCTFLRNLK
jgi:hypothetical protein